ncbi:hypothetical protein D3C78_1193650 [compost metagenome]
MDLGGQRRGGLPVAGDLGHRRPLGHHRQLRRAELVELGGGVDHLAVDHGEHRLDPLDRLRLDVEEVRRQRRQVGQLAHLDLALLALFAGEPGAAVGEQFQCSFPGQPLRVDLHPTDGLATGQPVQRGPGVVAGHPGGIGSGAHWHALRKHALDRRGVFGGLLAVAVDEVFPLESHAVLDGDATAEGLDPLDVARSDGFGVIEQPGKTVEGDVAVDLLEHVEHPRDGLIVGGV